MSLFGALSLGGSSLLAQQTALQVTGDNISNAGTAGYTRQAVNLSESGETQITQNQYVGDGVGVTSIQRQVNDSLNDTLRSTNSDESATDALNTALTQLQSTFGALNTGNLGDQLTSFFGSFSTLANNPTDPSQRAQVITNGVSLANDLQTLRGQITTLGSTTDSQIGTLAGQANTLVQGIASLNTQIATAGSNANSLQDQRDQDLSQLSQLMDIRTVNQSDGSVTVLSGSEPLVNGGTSRGISTQTTTNAEGVNTTQVVFADDGDPITVSGGQIGGLINARDNFITPAIDTVDTIAAGLINTVNSISTQGQGITGFSTVTSATPVTDPTTALNAGTAATGLPFTPTNGSFNLYITNGSTGTASNPASPTTQQINVDFTGSPPTSLNSLATSISAAGGGVVTAAVTNGKLTIKSNDPNVTFGFGADTSGVLASLGINTFFTGSTAADIGINSTLTSASGNTPGSAFLATGKIATPGSAGGPSANANILAAAGTASTNFLPQSLNDTYNSYIGQLASQAQGVSANLSAQQTIQSSLTAQQQSISGVSLDQETVNMMSYQRAFEGSARFITVVDEMMQTVLGLIT